MSDEAEVLEVEAAPIPAVEAAPNGDEPVVHEIGPPPPPPAEEPVLDGVFIQKQEDEQGNILPPKIIRNGNLGLLEIESLLKLGLAEFQKQMGFS